jgi:DNA-directed RNA polymerase specialized sigma24 family protein
MVRRLASARARRAGVEPTVELLDDIAMSVVEHLLDPPQFAALVRRIRQADGWNPAPFRSTRHALTRIVYTLANRFLKQYCRSAQRTAVFDEEGFLLRNPDSERVAERFILAHSFWTTARRTLSESELATLEAHRDGGFDIEETARRLRISVAALYVRLNRIYSVIRAAVLGKLPRDR